MTYNEAIILHLLEVLGEKNQSYEIMPFTDAALIKMNNADCVYTTEVWKAVYCSARSGFSERPMLGEKSELTLEPDF